MRNDRTKPQKRVGEMNEDERLIHKRNFDEAFMDFSARYDFRRRRKRNRDYLRGDQWNDLIYDHKYDDQVKEETYLRRRGRLTTKNNQIDPIIRNLIGQFRESYPSSIVYSRNSETKGLGDMMTEALRYVEDLNRVELLDVGQMREALISGAWGNRVQMDWFSKLNKSEVSFDPIDQRRLAYNSDLQDIRLKDLKRWVYLHDSELDEIISMYAESEDEAEKIANWYGRDVDNYQISWDQLTGSDIADDINFHVCHEHGKERVIEVWRKSYAWRTIMHDYSSGEYAITDMTMKEIEAINDERVNNIVEMQAAAAEAKGERITNADKAKMKDDLIENDEVELIDAERKFTDMWHVYHYTPWGDVLFESETPYNHLQSPLELSLHPMIDGEVYGLIESIVDQQKYFNRMISMLDFLINASAKGVLMIDKRMIPKEYIAKDEDGNDNFDAFLENWTEFDGVIYYESDPNNPGNMPQHIVNNSIPAGMNDMIQLQHELLEKISGVVGPVQGHTPSSGTPASLYMQQTVNASMTNRDIFDTFFDWMKMRNYKAIQLIQQYWTEVTYIKAGGNRSSSRGLTKYNPSKVQNILFDLVIGQGQQSAVYRQIVDEQMEKFMLNGLVTFEEYLEESTMPYATKLLEKVRERKKAMQAEEMQQQQQAMMQQGQGQPPQGMPQQQAMPQQGQPQPGQVSQQQTPVDADKVVERQQRVDTN